MWNWHSNNRCILSWLGLPDQPHDLIDVKGELALRSVRKKTDEFKGFHGPLPRLLANGGRPIVFVRTTLGRGEMEFTTAEDFRKAVTDCIESYTRARDADSPSAESCGTGQKSAVRTRGAESWGFAGYGFQCIAYLLGIAYYSIRIRDGKRKEGDEKTLPQLRPDEAQTDPAKDLDETLQALAKLAGSSTLAEGELFKAIYPIWKRICPDAKQREEGLVRYVLRQALFAQDGTSKTLSKDDLA